MGARKFYIEREKAKNPELEEMIRDHATDAQEVFDLMEDFAEEIMFDLKKSVLNMETKNDQYGQEYVNKKQLLKLFEVN